MTNWGDLGVRVASGVVLAALGACLLLSTGIVLHIGVSILIGVLIWELAGLTRWRQDFPFPHRAILLGAVAAICFLIAARAGGIWWILLALPILPGLLWAEPRDRVSYALIAAAIVISGLGLIVIRELGGLTMTLWLVGTVVISDVAGYFAGRSLGGPKFWPSISPKKTWSGTIAGWLGAMALAIVMVGLGVAGPGLIVIAPLIAFAGQMGDIAESWKKRQFGAKDSSQLIPGHGGLLDRFDAMCGALVMVSLFWALGLQPPIGG